MSAPHSTRDGQARSPFTVILEKLLAGCVGAIAAVLADEEGETVDQAGQLPAYDVKLAAAHWQLVMRNLEDCEKHPPAHLLFVRAEQSGYVATKAFAGYVLLIVCQPDATFTISPRAIRQAQFELCCEAAYEVDEPPSVAWRRVAVTVDTKGRPRHVRRGAEFEELEVLGPVEGLAGFERGYQVAASSGEPRMLVREVTGAWYLGEEVPL